MTSGTGEGGVVHFRVAFSCRAFDEDFAAGDLIERAAGAEAEKYAAFWMQRVGGVEHPFVQVTLEELEALTAPPAPEPVPPVPAAEALEALKLEELRAVAAERGVEDVKVKSQAELIEALSTAAAGVAGTGESSAAT